MAKPNLSSLLNIKFRLENRDTDHDFTENIKILVNNFRNSSVNSKHITNYLHCIYTIEKIESLIENGG